MWRWSNTVSRFGVIALAAVFCVAAPAHAHGGGHHHGTQTFSGSVFITGTPNAPTSGACPVAGFAGSCPDNNCMCVVVPGAHLGGGTGGGLHGTLTVSATIDKGEVNPATPCTPVYALMTGTLAGKNGSPADATIDAFLVLCADNQLHGGGWGLTATAGSGSATGIGSLSGTIDQTAGKVKLKATGTLKITQ